MHNTRLMIISVVTMWLIGAALFTSIAPAKSHVLVPASVLTPSVPKPLTAGMFGPNHAIGFPRPSKPNTAPSESKSLFLESETLPSTIFPTHVAVADFNGDGKADFAVIGQYEGSIDVYLAKGDGTFRGPLQIINEVLPYAIVAADFNNDGRPDLAIANGKDQKVIVYLGNGDGTFQHGEEYTNTNGQTISMVVGDFNSDGNLDILSTNQGTEYGISILFGNGDGTFKPVKEVLGSYGIFVVAGDFNNDGTLDLALTDYSSQVGILLGTGGGNFALPIYYSTGSESVGLAIADFNGDGKADLVTGNGCDTGMNCSDGSEGSVSVLLGNGDGTFQSHVDYPTGLSSGSVAVGDFNGDGKPDVTITNYESNTVSVLLGNGDGTFRPRIDYGTGPAPVSVAVGDFNGDGLDDIITANSYAPGNQSSLSVLLSNSGGFQARADIPSGTRPLSVAAADFDRDGNVDMAVAVASDNAVALYLGNGNGTFQQPVEYPVGIGPYVVKSADFNHDGNLDLAVIICTDMYCQAAGAVAILLGNGDGTFQSPVSYPVDYFPNSLVVGDFNGDGSIDLAIMNECGKSLSNCGELESTVSVLLGTGDGTFQYAPEFLARNDATSMVTADFNGDGVLDLAVTNSCEHPCTWGSGSLGAISVFLGRGDGTFKHPTRHSTQYGPGNLAVGDLNGDGIPDLVFSECMVPICTDYTESLISVVLGKGDGTFKDAHTFTAPPTISGLMVADLNGDGIPDVAALSEFDDLVAVFLGKGTDLRPYTPYDVGFFPISIVSADINNDGRTDLLVANDAGNNPGGGTVSVLLNIGTVGSR